MSTLDVIASQRVELATLLDSLTAEQLATPSLCGHWTVQEVAAHLLMPLVTPLRTFLFQALKAGGNFDRANDRVSRSFARRPISEIADGLRRQADNPFHAPTFGLEAPLAELLLHGQDIRRPLGLGPSPAGAGPGWEFPADELPTVLNLLASRKAVRGFVPRGLGQGLRFEATDVEWSSGDGAQVRGPGTSVAYAMSGRKACLGELTGPGVDILRDR